MILHKRSLIFSTSETSRSLTILMKSLPKDYFNLLKVSLERHDSHEGSSGANDHDLMNRVVPPRATVTPRGLWNMGCECVVGIETSWAARMSKQRWLGQAERTSPLLTTSLFCWFQSNKCLFTQMLRENHRPSWRACKWLSLCRLRCSWRIWFWTINW